MLTETLFQIFFELEEIREIKRNSVPFQLNTEEKTTIKKKINAIEKYLKKLAQEVEHEDKNLKSRLKIENIPIRLREENYINIQPIQPAGRLTLSARKALLSYGDGYSVCDFCRKPFRLDKIKKPAIDEFHQELASFVGMDEVRVVPGARRGFQAIVSSLVEKGDIVLVSALAHYTEFLAVENAGATLKEISLDNGVVKASAVVKKIEEVKEKFGTLPKLVIIDHFDYMFGNEHDVYNISKVCKEYDIPFLYNGAYSVGVMPVNGKKIGADFVVGSGHKSMGALAPSGIVGATSEFAKKIFKTTSLEGDLTKRRFGIKEVSLLGCTLMGATLITMMASLPTIKERVKNWGEEIKKSNYFLKEFLKIEGNRVLSEYPRKHTLTKVDTTATFDKIAKTHKRRGFFLSDELSKKGIIGPFPGATKSWKYNTYGLTWEQIKYLSEIFHEIAEKYSLDTR